MNTGITKTSSLFDEKQSGAQHGPRESSQEGDSVHLAHCGSRVDVEPKNTCTVVGALSIGMGHQNGIPVMA